MVKLKDLIKIMPNPQKFYLCILDEHDNINKHDDFMTYCRCSTYDFKSFSFYYKEDAEGHDHNRILDLLEYEVTCICRTISRGITSSGGTIEANHLNLFVEDFFIYIDKPLKKKKDKAKQEEQTDLFEDLDEVTA